MKNKILITGAGGFVGTNLAPHLSKNNPIICIDKKPRYKMTGTSYIIDLNDIHRLGPPTEGVNQVYHLAASADIRRSSRDPWWDFEDNVRATVHLLEFMRRRDIKEIKFISSSAVYGLQPGLLDENTPFKPINLYGSSKCSCEAYIMAYADLYGFKTTIFRPAQIIGDYEHRGVIVDFVEKLKQNPKELEILGDGNQLKSYIHISDCIRALLKLEGNTFNLANRTSITVKELANIVIDGLSLNPSITYTGGDRGWPGDTPFYRLSIEKAKKAGWQPKFSCEESIRKTVRWLNDKYYNTNEK